jgi:hypothetical protein
MNPTMSGMIFIAEGLHMDEFLPHLLEQWETPGIGVVILKDNTIVCAEGFGYRDVKNHLEMTANTIQTEVKYTFFLDLN